MNSPLTPEILNEHGQFVRQLAENLLRDSHLAEDVAQEVWAQWARHGARVTRARAWLRTAVRNTTINALRRRDRREHKEELGASPERFQSPDEVAAQQELLAQVSAEVFDLEEPYRSTLIGRYYQGLDPRTLGERDGVPPATVRTRERRALEKLRSKLDDHHGDRRSWAVILAGGFGREGWSGAAGTGTVLFGSKSAVGLAAGVVAALAWLAWPQAPEASPPQGERSVAAASSPDAQAHTTGVTPEAPRVTVAPLGASPAEEEAVEATPPPPGGGLATDTAGRPLPGVEVRLYRAGDSAFDARTSDAGGRFPLPEGVDYRRIEATLADHTLVASHSPEPGSSEPTRVVLAPTGHLQLRLGDSQGRPVERIEVEVEVRAEELGTPAGPGSRTRRSRRRSARSSAEGLVTFRGICSGVKLEVTVKLKEHGATLSYIARGHRDGELLLHPGTRGRPVLVPEKGSLELDVFCGDPIRLTGELVDGGGAPVRGSMLRITDLGRGLDPLTRGLAQLIAAPDGRFDVTLRSPYLLGPLRVDGWKPSDEQETFRAPNGRSRVYVAPTESEGSVVVDLPELEAGTPLVVRMRPCDDRTLAVQLHDGEGQPVFNGYEAHTLQGNGDPRLLGDQPPGGLYLGDGPFLVTNLGSGPFDLGVALTRPQAGVAGRFHVFGDVNHDGGVLPLHLPKTSEARVRLRVSGAPWARWSSMVTALLPHDRATSDLPRAPRRQRIERPGWPAGLGQGPDIHPRWENRGWVRGFVEEVAPGSSETLLELGSAGWYALGVLATDAEGRPLAPVATGFAWFGPGESEVEFVLRAAGSLEVTSPGPRRDEDLAVSLFDGDRRPLALPGTEGRTLRPLPTSGRLVLDPVPEGEWTLALGTPGELAEARPRFEARVGIQAGQRTSLPLRD